MRRIILLLLAISPTLTGWATRHRLAAQVVARADAPRRGALRLTVDPTILVWEDEYIGGARQPLGAPLTGDSVGAAQLPALARLQQDVRTAGGNAGWLASLGSGLLGVRAEQRITALSAEISITDRWSLGVTLPLVRVNVRTHLTLDTTGSSLGANPLAATPALDSAYATFFTQFDAALTQLDANIAGGSYGCPGGPQCAQAQALSDTAHAVRDALDRSVYGPNRAGGAAFLPIAGTAGGAAIDSNVTRIQQDLGTTYGVAGFTRSFLLPLSPVTAAEFAGLLEDSTVGFGAGPFADTRRSRRFWAGDAEVSARYRLAAGGNYAATVGLLVRLPTGHQDSPHNFLDLSTGDHQTDIEGQLVQELVVGGRLWLNLAVRGGQQRSGTRERRVAPFGDLLVPRSAFARLTWDPGDYVAVDFAPLYRLTPHLAAGVTVGYWHKGGDAYRFATPQDSTTLATRLGTPVSAAVLDAPTAERRVRLGGAVTYVGPTIEAGLSVQRTLSGAGGGGPIPIATVFRIVLRTSQRLF